MKVFWKNFLHPIGCILPATLFVAQAAAQMPQITVPRIEQMPKQPAPYNLRNWKEVALQYDSFVYDVNKTGQYLPVLTLQNIGYNYPQSPAFGLHTYIGTNSPNGNEAVNVLPSLVGASLCGADKRMQYGRNWIQMSQDFFSLQNGQGLYLNNKGGGSGSDWWYDMMPNVYFYQLCALYPPVPGSVADAQFLSVAEKLLASVKVLGGSETPWQSAWFDYRAFNFQTMQPNPGGVHEPEAAGAYAWILYNAWLKTGNEVYRKAAEWSLEFLHDWPINPSYELQLPYGTYTAARMNAELGTRYDVEKMLNWSFDRGPLRGWGTIVGNWGGFDCSGLVGEANDAGNDYAFQLNGVQQAAALVPMLRYDKRFAKAIGKWVLNLANATRLFYPGFLPANYQDASAWSGTNDPDRVVGYEALRQKWQGISPFSTGDALNGNWAATNLSLYSTGSIGYLGCMLEKTNVDKILKIDLLKTDFYVGQAYPAFLFYNPYDVAQTISFNVGAAPADVYDAVSEVFILENVSGSVNLTIPANTAVMANVCPAGGTRTFSNNKLLVNGVVVDYMQSQQSWTRAPRIQSLAGAQNLVEPGQTIALYGKVQSGDSPVLQYLWTAGNGQLSPSGITAQWTAPAALGPVSIQWVVLDGNGLSDTATLELTVVPEINLPPFISTISRGDAHAAPGGLLDITCVASDPNDDPLNYEWEFSNGTYTGNGATVQWQAPAVESIVNLKVTVRDASGLSAQAETKLLVKQFNAIGGSLIAHYNFSGNANDLTVNQLHGIPFSTLFVPDVHGSAQKALYFNGVNSRVTVNAQPVLNFQEGISVSAWFKANDLPAKETFLLSHGSWQNRWKVSFTPEKHLRWTVNTLDAIGDLDTEQAINTDSFYHFTVTYDGSLMAVYLNGQLESFKPLTGKLRTTNLAFLMGQMLPGNVEYNYKGVLDEVKIFDHALIPEEAKNLYDQSLPANTPEMSPGKLRIYPNPVSGRVYLERVGFDEPCINIQVFNTAGRLFADVQDCSRETLEIDAHSWPSGTYLMLYKGRYSSGRSLLIKI